MKLGEIKIQALSLMYPSATPSFDETQDGEINRFLLRLKGDSNLRPVLEGAVGSINRCFSYLESHGISPKRQATVRGNDIEPMGNKAIIVSPNDMYACLGVDAVINGCTYPCAFQVVNGKIIVDVFAKEYRVVYRAKIDRVTAATPEETEIPLLDGVCEIIPYFVKGEMYTDEDREEAAQSMERFKSRAEHLSVPAMEEMTTVYAVEWL